MIRSARCVPAVFAAMCCSTAVLAADSAVPEYRSSLNQVYGSYQAVLARRDACGTANAQARAAYEKAFTSWHARNKKVIAELDQHVAMMIHSASKDEKDYARNIGKYEGAILRQREEVKQTLLQQERSQLDAMCGGFVSFLQSADSDLEKEFPEELAVVRKRAVAKK
jgi:hypothetical protein